MGSMLRGQSRQLPFGQQPHNSIQVAASRCQELLQRCTEVPALMQMEWAENRSAEFKLWTATTGALAGGAASLDARLSMELETRGLVTGVLVLLTEFLMKCQESALRSESTVEEVQMRDSEEKNDSEEGEDGDKSDDDWWENELLTSDSQPELDITRGIQRGFSPWSDDSSSSDSDSLSTEIPRSVLMEAKVEVEQTIDHLTRIGLAIRKSGTSSRLHKADGSFNPKSYRKLRKHLELIILARGRREGSREYDVDADALTPIQERLILANLRRRNRYNYAKKHSRKLAVDATSSDNTKQLVNDPTRLDHPVDRTAIQTSIVTKRIEHKSLDMISPKERTTYRQHEILTATSASGVDQGIADIPERAPAPSIGAKTNITTTAAKVLYPTPPRKKGLRYFQCPCCSQSLPEMYREKTMWKKHLMADICPYTCILDDCPKPDTLYVTRDGWTRHIEKDHRQCWKCPACSTPAKPPIIFPSVDGFLDHLGQAHSGDINTDQYSTIVADASQPIPSGISRCPLCDSTGPADSPDLLDHIAEHLHSFSLRSLPWPKFESIDEDDVGDLGDDYFTSKDYFDQESVDGSLQDNSLDSDPDLDDLSSLSTDSMKVTSEAVSTGKVERNLEIQIAWVCALSSDLAIARAFLDQEHDHFDTKAPRGTNTYVVGKIGPHNILIATLDKTDDHASYSSIFVRDLLRSFPNIRVGLFVGIGGGTPSPNHDVRLGDIAVSYSTESEAELIQCDFGQKTQSGDAPFRMNSVLNRPATSLRYAITEVVVQRETLQYRLTAEDYCLRAHISRPPPHTDRLYRSSFAHQDPSAGCDSSCGNDPDLLVARIERENGDDPEIHYGLIASAPQPMTDAIIRDRLAAEMGTICLETEAVGMLNHFPCTVICGISDYSDSHRSEDWHGFAAAGAAAYAADLVRNIDLEDIDADVRIAEAFDIVQGNTARAQEFITSLDAEEMRLWLLPPDPSTNLAAARSRRQIGTGAWFLDLSIFSDWKRGHRQNLWLAGVSGCGKTVLSTTIFDHLDRHGPHPILYFFFDFNDTSKQTLESFLRSLAWQLYQAGGEAANRLHNLRAACRRGEKQPGIHRLSECIESMVQSFERVSIIIDGLDECTTTNALLSWMNAISSQSTLANTYLIVTGTSGSNLPGISEIFDPGNRLRVDGEALNNDIRYYIASRLVEDKGFAGRQISPNLVVSIQHKIENEANGCFRWVVCQLNTLAQCTSTEAMETALHAMQRDLDGTYFVMLQNIPKVLRSDGMRLLQFLLHAKEPLTVPEAKDIIATRIDTEPSHFNAKARLDFEDSLLQYCPDFICLMDPASREPDYKKVQLVHSTVRDYLLNTSDFQIVTASIAIVRTCIAYLNNVRGSPEETSAKFPLAKRASTILVGLARHAEADDIVLSELLAFVQDEVTYEVLCRLFPTPYRYYQTSPLYYTCKAGLLRVLRRLLENGEDVYTWSTHHPSPLYIAAEAGHTDIIELLLSFGAPVNAEHKGVKSPLQVASRNGHSDAVELLLRREHDITLGEDIKNHPLVLASSSGHAEVVRMLLNYGANLGQNFEFDLGHRALCQASRNGHIDVATLLLDSGASVYSWRASEDTNPAVSHEDAVEVAKSKTVAESIFTRALCVASGNGDMAKVTQILSHVAELDPQNNWYEVAVQAVRKKGHKHILRVLGGERLCQVSLKGDYAKVKALLDDGVNPTSRCATFDSALEAAASNEHIEVVRLLLERGADVNVRHDNYNDLIGFYENRPWFRNEQILDLLREHKSSAIISGE